MVKALRVGRATTLVRPPLWGVSAGSTPPSAPSPLGESAGSAPHLGAPSPLGESAGSAPTPLGASARTQATETNLGAPSPLGESAVRPPLWGRVHVPRPKKHASETCPLRQSKNPSRRNQSRREKPKPQSPRTQAAESKNPSRRVQEPKRPPLWGRVQTGVRPPLWGREHRPKSHKWTLDNVSASSVRERGKRTAKDQARKGPSSPHRPRNNSDTGTQRCRTLTRHTGPVQTGPAAQ